VLRLVQHTGVTRFSLVKAAVLGRGLVRAPLRLARRPGPHGHNIVLMNLTTGFSARAQESRPYGSGEPDRDGVGYGDRIPPLGLVPARPSA
jgi:hypothetical protein